jgi:GNAT superfamily N-acetyltransferase
MALVTLRDGSEVEVRAIRPGDAGALLEAFDRLSPESRYRRFLAPMAELRPSMVRYLTEVDHRTHEAIVALDARTGEGLGVARFVRLADRPGTAEAAVTVVDDAQGRGIGTLLLDVLAARARQVGVERFSALMLARNDDMRDMLERLGPTEVVGQEAGTIEIEAELPPAGLSETLRGLLRASRRARQAGG